MSSLRDRIARFLDSQAQVYLAQPSRLERDARVASRSAKDYAGRWFFELVQNSEDAEAKTIEVDVTEEAVYVADDGKGFGPSAVEAISGTDFSDKQAGTIGRKGVGFKAVYEITAEPQVFASQGEGLIFSRDRAKPWLRKNNLRHQGEVPYQWLPTFVSRPEAEGEDPALCRLRDFNTVVKLPFKSEVEHDLASRHLSDWPPYSILPFSHVNRLNIRNGEKSFKVQIVRDGSVWSLLDTRKPKPVTWKVLKRTLSPPDEVLTRLDPDDRRWGSTVGFLVAALVDAHGVVVTTEDFLPVHVFYPTEQHSPLRLLPHAEFLVKTDRTAVIPLKDCGFNSWIADRLADVILEFVNNAYSDVDRAANLRLLVPYDSRRALSFTDTLWNRIRSRARKSLRLPDSSGERTLCLKKARMLPEGTLTGPARLILHDTDAGSHLLHSALDGDKDGRKALQELGCQYASAQDILDTIKTSAKHRALDHDWVWACWRWLASWLTERPRIDEQKIRIAQIRDLPIVPVADDLLSPSVLKRKIVTWRQDDLPKTFPDWLPMILMDEWFRDRISSIADHHDDENKSIRRLLNELRIEQSGKDALKRALAMAITDFWEAPDDNPRRFLDFILESGWEEGKASTVNLQHCPVPVHMEGYRMLKWAKAKETYFGREWDNEVLALLYEGTEGIAWVQPHGLNDELDREYQVLRWLDAAPCPRIFHHPINETELRTNHKQYYEQERNTIQEIHDKRRDRGNYVQAWSFISGEAKYLDHLDPALLNPAKAAYLIRLLALNWETYYSVDGRNTDVARYCPSGCSIDQHASVDALWYGQVLYEMVPPLVDNWADSAPLKKCWLPDVSTRKQVGELLPAIDTDNCGSDRDSVGEWLTEIVRVRTRIGLITPEEWLELLSKRIPEIISAQDIGIDSSKRDFVPRWYEACVDNFGQIEEDSVNVLRGVPLLSRKGDKWAYRNKDVWLADDEELANAFRDNIWQIHFGPSRRDHAKKVFGLACLSEKTKIEYKFPKQKSKQSEEIRREFQEILPYVFAWRCSQTKSNTDRLRELLNSLSIFVVNSLKKYVELPGIARNKLDVFCGFEGQQILISYVRWEQRQSLLARALAGTLDVKTEEDLYENLLRCGTDEERQNKLLSKGVTRDEMERLVRLYSQEVSLADEVSPPARRSRTAEPGKKNARSTETAKYNKQVPTQSAAADYERSASPDTHRTTNEQPRLMLRNPRTAKIDIDIARRPSRTSRIYDHSPATPDRTHLSREQRDQIEKCGRGAAERKLLEWGYDVKQMPYSNPGFDIKATKENEELRVEVKAHRGIATSVEITSREYQEYLLHKTHNYIHWQLWNIENLSEGTPGPITIIRYDNIPGDALGQRTLTLHLNKCNPIAGNRQ